jgi:hypothetical protein
MRIEETTSEHGCEKLQSRAAVVLRLGGATEITSALPARGMTTS